MSDNDLLDLADSVFADGATPGTGLDTALWATLERTGLARLTLPEPAGGGGGTLTDAAAVLQAAGAHAARVPLVETELAAWLLHTHGLDVPAGPLTVTTGALMLDGTRALGTLARVGWARDVAGIAVLIAEHVVVLVPGQVSVVAGTNLAEEPRDTVTVDVDAVSAPARDGAAAELRLRAALGRSQLLAGAARGALARTVQYAGERVQFGRSIGKFQAVQQQLALAAAEVAAAGAAASAAASTAERDGFGAASTAFAVAAAKARTSESAGEVARIAHQVHGAIGFTREHDLRLLTTRLWAWRDEDGSEALWQAQLGATVLAAGADALWPTVTGTP